MARFDCEIEELSHTAEIGLRVRAGTLPDLYACAARGLFEIMQGEPSTGNNPVTRTVSVVSRDAESLLVDWLSELLYLHEVTGALFDEFAVHAVTAHALEATVTGHKAQQRPALQVKAVTYHQLRLAQEADRWIAEVFFDI